ncbi:MAG TPA: hypothetical protein VK980_04245 [Sphingomonas sp.]|nr:hypothetical protein [Sphingomonas sp.]
MPDHASTLSARAGSPRKNIARDSGGTSPIAAMAPGNALAGTAPVQSLAATGRMLNARPALVAQRRLAAHLSRAPQQAPIQRVNGQPAAAAAAPDDWGDFGADAQQMLAANAAAAAAANAVAAPANPAAVNPAPAAANAVIVNPPVVAANAPPAANPLPAAANPVVVNVAAVNVAAAAPAAGAVAAAAPAAANNGLKVATGAHRESNGPMYTTGLVNCIALVAYNPQTPLASLYHWDTRDGGLETVADEDGGRDEDGNENTHYVAHQPGVTAAKAVVDGAVPGATSYHAVLGPGWNRGALIRPRRAFIAMLRTTFNGITIDPVRHGNARWVAPDLTGY